MSRFSEWYYSARKRLERDERVKQGLKESRAKSEAHTQLMRKRAKSLRAETARALQEQRDYLDTIRDMPPWEQMD